MRRRNSRRGCARPLSLARGFLGPGTSLFDPYQCDRPGAWQRCAGWGLRVTDSETQSRAETPFGFAARAIPSDDGVPPDSESEFLALLGNRVRGMRRLRAMSRRELARRSQISERYIAQIEAGKGNVSIMLLLRIAHAIRCG